MKRGYTLIELIVSIAIIAVCIAGIASVYQNVLQRGVRGKIMTTACALAEEKADEVLRLGFSGIGSDGPADFSSPFGDYSYQVVVINVQPPDLDTSVGSTDTGYKKVTVNITHDQAGTYGISSLLTDH